MKYVEEALKQCKEDKLLEKSKIPRILTDIEKNELQLFIEFFTPLYESTKLLEKDSSHISQVLLTFNAIFKHLDSFDKFKKKNKNLLEMRTYLLKEFKLMIT